MNSKRLFLTTIMFTGSVLLSVLLMVHSCKKPTEGVKLIINTNLITTTLGISFVDANTGEPMGYDGSFKVKMTLSGQNASSVIDVTGTTEYKTDKGFSNLAVDPDVKPTSTNPVRFNIVASAAGYLTTSMPVILEKEGGHALTVSMIKISSPPDGVAAKSTTITTDVTGAATATQTITSGTPNTNKEKTEATVTIPAGTILKDAGGNPVTGTLSTTLVYHNNLDDASLLSFPGGLGARTDQGDLFFASAGFVSLEIQNSTGTHVSNFSSPISVIVQVPLTTMQPDGSGNVKAVASGDSVPVWSYEVTTGEWTYEAKTAVTTNTSGKLEVTFDVNHLSYWNLDWFYGNSCTYGATINISSNINVNTTYYYFELRRKIDGSYLKSGYQSMQNGTSFTFLNAPDVNAVLQVFEGGSWWSCSSNKKLIGEIDPLDVCNGTYTLNVNAPAPQPIYVKVTAKCENKPNFVIKPTIPIYFKEVGSTQCNWWQYAGYMINGEITSYEVKKNKTYVFGLYFDGKWYESPAYTVTKDSYVYDYVFTTQTCNKLFN